MTAYTDMGYQNAFPAQLVDAERQPRGQPQGAAVEAIKVAAQRAGVQIRWVLACSKDFYGASFGAKLMEQDGIYGKGRISRLIE